jgi:2-keto-4-pentenoate hydratase
VKPHHREALREQLRRRRALLDGGARHAGWKVGANIEEIGEPVVGHLTTATLVAPGAICDISGVREPRAETELLLEVMPDGGIAFGVALELVDVARPPHDAAEIIARNVFHVAWCPAAGRTPAPGARARLWVDGEVAEESAVGVDAAAVVALIREQLRAVGEELRAGDVILSGSLCHVPVCAGVRLAAEVDGLGRVGVQI